jgi:hypothetical protein
MTPTEKDGEKGHSAVSEVGGDRECTINIHKSTIEGDEEAVPRALKEIQTSAMKETGTPHVHIHTTSTKLSGQRNKACNILMCRCAENVRMKIHQTALHFGKLCPCHHVKSTVNVDENQPLSVT